MNFRETSITGVWLIDLERHVDERGFFARTFCRQEMVTHGISGDIVQQNLSFNERQGTVRGLHFAWPPQQEGKLVRVSRGAAYEVIVDLRPRSPTFLCTSALELSATEGTQLWVPPGCAYGFQTLEDKTEVLYSMSAPFRPELAAGYRFDDPAFAIVWPLPVAVIAERDRLCPDFEEHVHRRRWAEQIPAGGEAR